MPKGPATKKDGSEETPVTQATPIAAAAAEGPARYELPIFPVRRLTNVLVHCSSERSSIS